MKSFQNVALGLIAAAATAVASDVHDLKQDTFAPFIKENNLVLAEFFAPWCGHCKALAPEYEEAATTLKEKDISLVKVDCTAEVELCKEYGVEGYPTLKVFRGLEDVQPYAGQRKAPAIISYMTKQSLPAVSVLSKDTLEEFKVSDKVVVVAYHDAKDTKSNESFTELAQSLRNDYLFGAISDADAAKAAGVKQPGIVMYKQFDEGKTPYSAKSWSQEDLTKWVKQSATPLIGEVGPETYAGYMSAGIPLGYIFAETAEEREKLAKEFKPIAEKHKGKLNIATIDAKSFGQHAGNLNLKVGEWPAFAIQNTVDNTKYPLTDKLNAKNLGKFVDQFVAGKLEPSIKSEPIPEKQDGPVTIIVAKNYKDIVQDDTKDVLVEFYAPWCGHCKALAPKYDQLGSMFKPHSDKVVVAKVDATANDVPEEIQGFPTIKLYPAGKKSSPIDYTGSRTVEDLAKFIQENGTHKVEAEPLAEEDESSTAKKVAEKVVEGAAKVVDAVVDADETVDDHDEL